MALVAPGCGGQAATAAAIAPVTTVVTPWSSTPSSTSLPTSPATADLDGDVAAAVIAAHRSAEAAFDATLRAEDPDLDGLADSTADPILTLRRGIVAAHIGQGWRVVDATVPDTRDVVERVETVDASTVDLEVCLRDDSVIVDAAGAEINGAVGIHRQRHRFRLMDGTWKLTQRETLASGEESRCPF